MRKYFQLAKITFQEYFVYRLNFLLWWFRSIVSFVTLLFFWLVIYGGRNELLGYQKAQMLTYVVGITFLRSFVLASRSADLAGQVRSGELTKFFLQPIKIIWFWLTRDTVDKILNLFFVIFEISAILFFIKFPFYFPHNFSTYFYFLIMVTLALFLYFFMSFCLSVIAFWTDEVWATRFLFGVIFFGIFCRSLFPH